MPRGDTSTTPTEGWDSLTTPGDTVIFLNGTSSSGKSSVARELQRLLERPFAVWSSDAFRRMWSDRAPKGEAGSQAARAGFHRCVAALASAGNNVIVDSILRTDEHRAEVAALLRSLPAYLVAVRCSLHVAEDRELARGDRKIGLARMQFEEVHSRGIYDVEVDTSLMTAAECAEQIQWHVEQGPAPVAFAALHRALRPVP